MATGSRSILTPNVVVGLAIVLFGVVLLLDKAGVIEAWELLRYWPVLLILFGISVIWQGVRGDAGGVPVHHPPLVGPGFVVLLIFGAMFSQAFEHRAGLKRVESTADEPVLSAVLGKVRHASRSTNFRGAELSSVMGDSSLNLRGATMAQDGEAVVDVFALMGKVELLVPENWVVEVEAKPFMGKVEDSRRTRSSPSADWRSSSSSPSADGSALSPGMGGGTPEGAPPSGARPRLVIRGFVMMGAVEVAN